eukprot:TRINITY_DN6071_c0_g1_i1.p1 TRINITY_DN6071_c0_g1~~TRINITY_DN6071_c0_g1_i1.p1  ORF type:complete len:275 (+),score=64.36 TRINITY_DN6071_c0_g1_i1:48-827(+)
MPLPCAVGVLLACCAGAAATTVTSGMRVACRTTVGDFAIEMTPERGPLGAQHYVDLVEDGFYTDVPLFRVVSGFLVQYGIPGRREDKAKTKKWTHPKSKLEDDPHPKPQGRSKMQRGDMSFAGAGPNSRTTQVFIAYTSEAGLGGALHETPFGRVVEGMDAVDKFFSGYGDTAPWGKLGPDQGRIWHEGNAYLKSEFPKMDYILSCSVVPPTPTPPTTAPPLSRLGPEVGPNPLLVLVLSGIAVTAFCYTRGRRDKRKL